MSFREWQSYTLLRIQKVQSNVKIMRAMPNYAGISKGSIVRNRRQLLQLDIGQVLSTGLGL